MSPPRPSSSSSSRSQTPFDSLGLDSSGAPPPDPTVWSEEQQKVFLQALMGGAAPAVPEISHMAGMGTPGQHQQQLPDSNASDPLAALMAQLSQPGQQPAFAQQTPSQPPKPPTLLQKLMPLLHLFSVWALLAYFVFWKEPQVLGVPAEGWSWSWEAGKRWAQLGRGMGREGWGVEAVVRFTLFFCEIC